MMSGDAEVLLTVNDLRKRWKVGRTTVYRIINAGELKLVRVGESPRFRLTDVVAYEDRPR